MSHKELSVNEQIKVLRGGIQMLHDAINNHLNDVDDGIVALNRQNIQSWTVYLRADERLLAELEGQLARSNGQKQVRAQPKAAKDDIGALERARAKLMRSVAREERHVEDVMRTRNGKIRQLQHVEAELSKKRGGQFFGFDHGIDS